MKTTLTILAAAAALLLTGCAPTEGTVTDRDYYPAHKNCVKSTCKHKPEQWQLHLDNGRDPCVPQAVHDAHPVGSYFVDNGTAYYWGCAT